MSKIIGNKSKIFLKRTFFSFLVSTLLFSFGCHKPAPCPERKQDIDYPSANASSELSVNTYINLGKSMSGFLSASDKYNNLIDKISNLPIKNWTNGKHKFYEFNKKGITQENSTQKFMVIDNYSEDSKNLEDIFKSNTYKKDNLNVIVTDFSQKILESNYNLVNNLVSNYITKGLSVGLISVKLPFKGDIYPEGISNEKYNYTGDRNIFVLVLGKYGDVKKYFLDLKTNQELGISYSDFTIFSHHIIYHKVDFETFSKDKKGKMQEIVTPEDSSETSDMVTDENCNSDDIMKQYILNSNSENFTVEKFLEFEKFEFTPDFRNLKSEVKIEKIDDSNGEFKDVTDELKKEVKVFGYKLKKDYLTTPSPLTAESMFTNDLDDKNIRVMSDPSKSLPLATKIKIDINTKDLNTNTYRLHFLFYSANSNHSSSEQNENNYTYRTLNDYKKLSLSKVEKDECLKGIYENKNYSSTYSKSSDKCGKTINLASFVDSLLNSMEYRDRKASEKQLFNDKKLYVAEFYYYLKKE